MNTSMPLPRSLRTVLLASVLAAASILAEAVEIQFQRVAVNVYAYIGIVDPDFETPV